MSLPVPYYDDGNGIVIYHGDALDILPDITRVDLVFLDAPYGLGIADWDILRARHEEGE